MNLKERIETNMLYFCCGFSSSYGPSHGMYYGTIDNYSSLAEAEIEARDLSREVVENYDCIMEDILACANEEMYCDETPDDPSVEYLDVVEEMINEELASVVYLVTVEGEQHINEMESDMSDYPRYLVNGWLVDPYEKGEN